MQWAPFNGPSLAGSSGTRRNMLIPGQNMLEGETYCTSVQ